MGSPSSEEMAAAQVFVTVLWAASLAPGAPQRLPSVLPATSSIATLSLNQNQVVSDVVLALQPSIAQAVADALASLNSRSVASTSSGSLSRGSLSSSSRGSLSSLSSSSRSRSGSVGTTSATATGAE